MGLTRFLGVILILTALSAPVHALSAVLPPGQSVTLAWIPSVDPNIAGCNLYYGVASGTYTQMVNPGTATSVTISGLVEGTTYFFAATSYDIFGLESDWSNEASYTVPGTIPGALAKLQIRVSPTRQVILTVTGQVGRTYNIQASPDFTTWTVIGTVMVPAGGSLDFTDTNAASFPKRFYRIVPETIPGALARLQIRAAPAGQVVLTVTGQVGRTYNIQASPDFTTWTVIGTVMVPAGGSLDFTDTNAASFPKRFYRAQ